MGLDLCSEDYFRGARLTKPLAPPAQKCNMHIAQCHIVGRRYFSYSNCYANHLGHS